MTRDLTQGSVRRALILFSLPIMAGNLLQQFYNVADTLIVSRWLGPTALAAVGSSGSLMVLLTSVLLGAVHGQRGWCSASCTARATPTTCAGPPATLSGLIAALSLALTVLASLFLRPILLWLNTPAEALPDALAYMRVILLGMPAAFAFNFGAAVLRAVGNSMAPLLITVAAALGNVGLDLLFVVGLRRGTAGAAEATVLCQYGSAVLALAFCSSPCPACAPPGGLAPRRRAAAPAGPQQCAHQPAAVGDELRHPAGAGAGEQLRRHGHGRLCRRRQDRQALP